MYTVVQWLQLCLLSSECTIECECSCFCLPSVVRCVLFLFAAGALGPAEPSQAQTIYQAVVDKNWRTARELLRPVMKGKLSGSV